MNKSIFHFFIYLISFVFLSAFSLNAQKTETINGVKYYIHTVEQGQTLYSISKKYEISVADVVNANKGADKGLSIGQTLKIPVSKAINVSKQEKQVNEKVDGLEIHTVSQGETVFSISRKYGIDLDELYVANPGLTSELKIGQKIKIPPFGEQVTEVEITNEEISNVPPAYIVHKVVKGETLYSIARFYDVYVDSLTASNPGIKFGSLTEGQEIVIPVNKNKQVLYTGLSVKSDTLNVDSGKIKESYTVSLLLPFYLDVNDTIEASKTPADKETIYPKSEIALHFYEGFSLALDSMDKTGFKAKINVFDTNNDSAEVSRLLKNSGIQNSDLIIGPLYQSMFEYVTANTKCASVCPVALSNKVLLGNPRISKVVASQAVQTEEVSAFISSAYAGENILLFCNNDIADLKMAGITRQKINASNIMRGGNKSDTVKYYYSDEVNVEKIKSVLSSSGVNVLIVPSSNQPFVTDFLTKIYHLSETYQIIVFGTEKWKSFENIDIDYFHKLNVHIPQTSFINYDSIDVQQFINKFKKIYKTEPGKFAFMGYDIGLYYLNALKLYGTGYNLHLIDYKAKLLSTAFSYFKTGPESGYENTSVYILKYENYKLIQVN